MKESLVKFMKGVPSGVLIVLISALVVWLFTSVLYTPQNMVTKEAFAKNCEIIEEKLDKKANKETCELESKLIHEQLNRIENKVDDIHKYATKNR